MTHWISYSEPSASRIADALQAMGEDTLCHPVTRIEQLPLHQPMPEAKPDLIIALSQHAVSAYLANYYRPSHNAAKVLAIGPATARGLIDTNNFHVETPREANSEGLLALPALQNVGKEQSVWLLTGEGGRDVVAQALANKCNLSRFNLYRREASIPTTLSHKTLRSIWIGSIHGLQQVSAGSQALGLQKSIPLVLPSLRVADHASSLGWYKLVLCKGSEPEQVQQACERIANDEAT
jgi:uroporphyrinogen-III synthase